MGAGFVCFSPESQNLMQCPLHNSLEVLSERGQSTKDIGTLIRPYVRFPQTQSGVAGSNGQPQASVTVELHFFPVY